MSENATIQIKIGAVELTVPADVDRDQLADVLAAVKYQLPQWMEAAGERAQTLAAAELLARSDARTFGEKAAVAAYWLEQFGGRQNWRSGDIVDVLREAGESEPANITDTLNQKLKKGLFEVNDRRWRLTGEGRGWVKYRLLNTGVEDEPVATSA